MAQAAAPSPGLVDLVPLNDEQLAEWLPASLEEYAESLRATDGAEADIRDAVAIIQALFAEGTPPDDLLWSIRAEHVHVGVLWLTPGAPTDDAGWWINDLMVFGQYRRRGYARAAIQAAVLEATRLGAGRLGLSVFADNDAARRLYRAEGFQEMQIDMSIRLPRAD